MRKKADSVRLPFFRQPPRRQKGDEISVPWTHIPDTF
nr:MAG TPA: hypothetical protein [Caudoviricetes sp.]